MSKSSYAQGLSLVGDKEAVTLYLGWTHQFQFAGYYMAKEKGYYDELGLDVTFDTREIYDNISIVAKGGPNYGISTAGRLLASAEYDKLVALAVIFQQSPVALLTLKSSGINSLSDLEGKTIAAGSELQTMLLSAGVDLTTVKINGYTTGFNNLLDGSYDAVSYYVTDHGSKLPGSDSVLYNVFRPIEFGVQFYGESLYTNREELSNNRERAQNMLAASLKGWEYAIAHDEETIDLIFSKYYAGLSREELQEEADITVRSLILPFFHDLGDMQVSKWQRMLDLLISVGVVSEPRELDGFLYNDKEANVVELRKMLYWFGLVIGLILLAVLMLVLYNWQLKRAVIARTYSLQKTNRELDSFVYSVSHDIRSPLSSIQGIINLMKLDPENNEKYISLIKSSVDRLESFTGDILDYSRNSRSELKFNDVNVDSVIEKSTQDLMFLDENKRVEFIKKIKLPETFKTDEWRLEVILGNLISNSIKYVDTDKGDPFVAIEAFYSDRGLHLIIEDNGIGIEDKHLESIFDMFYRATEASTGSGLGLYIVNETVKQLNGKIHLDSKFGRGTKVEIILPKINK